MFHIISFLSQQHIAKLYVIYKTYSISKERFDPFFVTWTPNTNPHPSIQLRSTFKLKQFDARQQFWKDCDKLMFYFSSAWGTKAGQFAEGCTNFALEVHAVTFLSLYGHHWAILTKINPVLLLQYHSNKFSSLCILKETTSMYPCNGHAYYLVVIRR